MKFGSEVESLKRRLAEAEENLRLVRERKSEFVQQTDVPLQLIKDERRLAQEIETLKARLAQDETVLVVPAAKAPIVKLPPLAMLLLNLVIVAVLALNLGSLVSASLPCVSPLISAPSLAVILLLLFHLVWYYLGPAIRETSDDIEVGPVAVPIKVLASLFDALHPWILSDRAPWVMAVVLSLAAGILGLSLSPLSPLRPPPEDTPVTQSFSVEYLERGGTTVSLKPSDVVEVSAGEQVLVQAETLGQDGILCTWSAASGNLQSAQGCATLYNAPFYETYDVLTIRAQSPCKTQNAYASFTVKVVLRNQ
jgi:hypothetical protein